MEQGIEHALDILRPLPTPDYPGGAWDLAGIRRAKMRSFVELASEVSVGCIVELGTWRGLGAIALTLGAPAGVRVHTIDHYQDSVDDQGFAYRGIDDRHIAALNFDRFLAQHPEHKPIIWHPAESIEQVALWWNSPIGLLVWDLGVDSVLADVGRWLPHVLAGGVVAVKDTETRAYKSQYLQTLGLALHRAYPEGCVYSFRKVA